jgi:hypothetical protein
MQIQNCPTLSRTSKATAIMAFFVVGFSMLAAAQREDANTIFATAPKVATSLNGVSVFAAPPKGFNPLTATNVELLTYGLPQRPDKVADEKGYSIWERAMLSTRMHVTDVRATPYSSRTMMTSGTSEKMDASGSTAVGSSNWSGIANTNKNTTWNNNTSFTQVASVWNVPVAKAPFGDCSFSPLLEVSWNGIDGWSSGDVVQGGSGSYFTPSPFIPCVGDANYFGWVEWYPSYPIIELMCGNNPCPVSPGDDFFVVTFASPGFASQNVYVNDLTEGWFGTTNLSWKSGPGVVGNSAEYIVERPCCDANGRNEPLVNYLYEFFDFAHAVNGKGTEFYPGSSSASTLIITMKADDGTTPISHPRSYGTSGNEGKYAIWMEDLNCTYIGGCTP